MDGLFDEGRFGPLLRCMLACSNGQPFALSYDVSNLVQPLLAQVIRLALDAESRNSQCQVTLVERSSPLESWVDDGRVSAGDVVKDAGNVGSVDVDGVDVGEAVGILVHQRQVLKLLGQVIERSVGSHGCERPMLEKLLAGSSRCQEVG